VTTDITTLDNAIKSFKNEFGVEPPSQITLCEAAADWNTQTASRAILGRIWPQFDFSIPRDFNLDGTISGTYTLTGAECLVFFLGGATTYIDTNANSSYDSGTDTLVTVNGFSKNPANPFAMPITAGATRQGPFYTFADQSRLIPVTTNSKGGFFFGYSDPITGTLRPYIYVNSNEGQGYTLADLNMSAFSGITSMTDAYRNGAQTATNAPYWNPNGYQIISAGFDRNYGTGGNWQKSADLGGTRDAERDNITNFSNGLLVP
jgi:hypothetical protein